MTRWQVFRIPGRRRGPWIAFRVDQGAELGTMIFRTQRAAVNYAQRGGRL